MLAAKYMQTECLNHKFVYDSPMQTQRLVVQVRRRRICSLPSA